MSVELTDALIFQVLDNSNQFSFSKLVWKIGFMSYWLGGHEGERNNCFRKIQLVGQKYRE